MEVKEKWETTGLRELGEFDRKLHVKAGFAIAN